MYYEPSARSLVPDSPPIDTPQETIADQGSAPVPPNDEKWTLTAAPPDRDAQPPTVTTTFDSATGGPRPPTSDEGRGPDYAASVGFLRKFHPGRLWVLTALLPNKPRPGQHKEVTATFDETREQKCREWLEQQGQTRNIYFAVNLPKSDVFNKTKREEIDKMYALHVDIDPRDGEPLNTERTRILSMLSPEKLAEKNLPPASAIVFSGGGYQAFWLLTQPLELGCNLAVAEDAALYNLKIEIELSADSCHDVCRIMRLPGTINRPDDKKRAKGRTDVLSEVASFPGEKYGLDCFVKSPPIANSNRKLPDYETPKLDKSKVTPLASVDELPNGVSEETKTIIQRGHDPRDPNRFGSSRSEWLFRVVCDLHKAQVPRETIYSIITDARFGVSASVLDKGSRIEKYAMRQIERAEAEQNPWLKYFNDRFTIIETLGGKCRVMEWVEDEVGKAKTKRLKMEFQSFEDFQNRFMHRKVDMGFNDDGKPVEKPAGLWWLTQEHRNQKHSIVFAPGRDVEDKVNLWRGFAVLPKPGECGLYLDHLRNIACNGVDEYYRYLIGWMASAIQYPDQQGVSAVVLKGAQGAGKSFPIKIFGSLFGQHFMQVSDPKHLVGSFNAHLRDCVVLFADEAFYAGDKKHESILKAIITEDVLMIESKGVNAHQSPNYIHLMMASNDKWVVPVGEGDRRFFILKVSPQHKEDLPYFDALENQMYKQGGREALLHYLQQYDLGDFDVRTIPKTDEHREQQQLSLPPMDEWVVLLATDGGLPACVTCHGSTGQSVRMPNTAYSNHPEATRRGLYADARERIPALRSASDMKLGLTLRDWACVNWTNGQNRGWTFPPLKELREKIDARYGKRKWPGGDHAAWHEPANYFEPPSSSAE
jgi:hypothetical protein